MTTHSIPSPARPVRRSPGEGGGEGQGEEGASLHSFVARYGLGAKLALIPWNKLPVELRQACDQLLASWWDSMDPDEPIQASGLLDMTVAPAPGRLALPAREQLAAHRGPR